ncbi:MAG: hypothetical protein ACKOFT_10075 [Actinomycetota bacterium]
MSRRIEIELTSKREDGTWTWRAAGAREPKGVVDSSVVPAGASVKDVLRAEVESDLDGTRVLSILPAKQKTARTGLLEILPSDKPFEPVTQKLARKERREDGKRGPRRDRPANKDGEKSDRPQRSRRPHFEAPPELPMRPKAKRLRSGRANVDAVLKDLPEAQRAIAEKVLSGGVPAVRAAVEQQNKAAVAAGQEKIPAEGLVQMAEQLLPRLRVAEWLDKAEGAQRIIAEIDLRDLRAIVVASNDPVIARDESTRTLVDAMKAALAKRQDEETKNWLDDIQAATNVGRVVRALKLSSQPPKAGVPFPAALAAQLAAATTAALTIDAPADRWIALLEAAAFSPVRLQVNPVSPSSTVSPDLTKTVMRLGPLMPQVAALYGVVVDPKAPAPRPLRPQRQEKPQPKRADGKSDRAAGRPDRAPRRDGKPQPAAVETQPAAAEPQPTSEPVAPEPVQEAQVESAPEAADTVQDGPAAD